MTSRLDPTPLPHGTEVTTLAERVANGRRLPRGVVGRVLRARDGGFDVLVPGLGEAWYDRDELTPRRAGQLDYAERRERAWAALMPCRVLEATVGSRAWGLAHERSDTDVRGAFALPLSWTLGLVPPPQDLVSADGSATYWEVRKLVHQALRADPNTLETLFVPSVRALDELGAWVLAARDAFPSRLIFGSFGRYALSQLRKLSSAQRLGEHRDRVLDWLTEEPAPSLDSLADRLAAVSNRPDGASGAKLYLKQLARSLADQGLIATHDLAALTAYARSGARRPPDARSLRPKNAYNLLRLLHLATGWLATGAPTFAPTGAVRERLLAIKEGAVPLDDVLAEADALSPALEAARDASPLPERPDLATADALLQRLGQELARRFVTRTPGSFGAEAPPAPTPTPTEDP